MTRTGRPLTAAVLLIGGLLLSGCSPSKAAPAPAATSTTATTATTAADTRIQLPSHPTVYFFGDSWTHGATAAPGRGFPEVVGETLGWNVVLGPNNSGSGYVHTYDPSHELFSEKAAGLGKIHADLIILEGGLNDQPGPLEHFWVSVMETVKTLRAAAGGAPLIIVGPASPDGITSEGLSAIDYEEAGAAKQVGVPYISPVKEQWFTPANVKTLVDPKTFHPNTLGHAYYAGRLAADLGTLSTAR